MSKLLNSCLTAVKKHWIRYYDTNYERDRINYFRSIKNSNDVLNKFKSKNFQASKLSTYDFSTLYTTLPHHLRSLVARRRFGSQARWRPLRGTLTSGLGLDGVSLAFARRGSTVGFHLLWYAVELAMSARLCLLW